MIKVYFGCNSTRTAMRQAEAAQAEQQPWPPLRWTPNKPLTRSPWSAP